ncbi:MMPL family transporter [Streptomyces fructofermentans]|uniref:MMPL family transporter n=1 Tax=Streptomyces fructofermentans TaxID=152141 RepID=UPI0037A7DD0E
MHLRGGLRTDPGANLPVQLGTDPDPAVGPDPGAALGAGPGELALLGLVAATAAGLLAAVTLLVLRTRAHGTDPVSAQPAPPQPAPAAPNQPALRRGPTETGTMTHTTGTPDDTCRAEPEHRAPAGLLHRLGRRCARRPWRVLAAWLLVLLAAVAADRAWGGSYEDDFAMPGTSAQTGADLLDAHGSKQVRGTASQIVLHPGDGPLEAHRDTVGGALRELGELPEVISVSDPFTAPGAISADGTTGIATIRFTQNPVRFDRSYLDGVDDAVSGLRTEGVQVEYGGPLGQLARPEAAHHLSETIGLVTAVVVLLAGFGSLAAAGFPLLTAVVALLAGISLLGLLAAVFGFGTAAPTLATMMGLGVGIDYALFLITRHRRLLRDTDGTGDPAEAAGRAVATSGRAVVVAAATVALALAGLYASGVGFIGTLGFAAGLTVVVAALAALTLAPALLGIAGHRIDRRRIGTPVDEPTGTADAWHRWAAAVGRRPWQALAVGLLALGVLSVPAASMRLGHVDAGAGPVDYTDRRAFDLVSDGFGPGTNGQLTVVVDLDGARARSTADITPLADSLRDALARTPGAAAVSVPAATEDQALLIATVTPETGPEDKATSELLHRLADDTLPDALADIGAVGHVTGPTAAQLTFRDVVADRLPLIIAVVVAAAFLLLLVVFRSLLVALKAALLNLLSIGAAYGVVVAVFQWGWGGSLFGVPEPVPVESYVPMMMFAIAFGLSMDYEVFLLSSIRESWLDTKDNHVSVATGLAGTARVITCAALIMTSVFLAFLLSTNVVVKMLALGLGVSVVIDATLVRLLLVPSTMYLLGRANWWLPRWMDRVLPHLDPEGRAATVPGAAADAGRERSTVVGSAERMPADGTEADGTEAGDTIGTAGTAGTAGAGGAASGGRE